MPAAAIEPMLVRRSRQHGSHNFGINRAALKLLGQPQYIKLATTNGGTMLVVMPADKGSGVAVSGSSFSAARVLYEARLREVLPERNLRWRLEDRHGLLAARTDKFIPQPSKTHPVPGPQALVPYAAPPAPLVLVAPSTHPLRDVLTAIEMVVQELAALPPREWAPAEVAQLREALAGLEAEYAAHLRIGEALAAFAARHR